MIDNGRLANGFTLAEILVSTLLLSIFAVGTFKASQFTQTSATASLRQFQNLYQDKQDFAIRKLSDHHTTILVDKIYPQLNCLIRQYRDKQARPETNCSLPLDVQ